MSEEKIQSDKLGMEIYLRRYKDMYLRYFDFN